MTKTFCDRCGEMVEGEKVNVTFKSLQREYGWEICQKCSYGVRDEIIDWAGKKGNDLQTVNHR